MAVVDEWGVEQPPAMVGVPPDLPPRLARLAQVQTTGVAVDVDEHRLSPDDIVDATGRTGLDEPTLLAWLTGLDTDLDATVIDFVNAWRAAGLPEQPPAGADRYVDRDPAELRAWLDAGFDLYAADKLSPAGLDTAVRWRHAGFGAAETYELLRADPALTVAEAQAFDVDGPVRQRRREWIYYGFAAADAKAWTNVGLSPQFARIWRALGKPPADVRPGQRIPPQLIENRRYSAGIRTSDGEFFNPEWDAIPDPPGTRGRRSRRRAGDDDPWINAD